MNPLPTDSKPTGQPGIFELRRLSTFTLLAFWQTEDTATQEMPSPSCTFVEACSHFMQWIPLQLRCNLYQVLQNQQNTLGLLSWENWPCSAYLRFGNQKKQLFENYQSFLHIYASRIGGDTCHMFRYDFTCTLYRVFQNQQDTPGFLSDHPTYLSLGNRRGNLYENYQSFLDFYESWMVMTHLMR